MATEYNRVDFEGQLFGFGDWRDSCVTIDQDTTCDTWATKFYEACALNIHAVAGSAKRGVDVDNMSITGEKCISEINHPLTDPVSQKVFKVERIKRWRKFRSSDDVLNQIHSLETCTKSIGIISEERDWYDLDFSLLTKNKSSHTSTRRDVVNKCILRAFKKFYKQFFTRREIDEIVQSATTMDDLM